MNKKIEQIFLHDIESAVFVVVSIGLFATLSTFAADYIPTYNNNAGSNLALAHEKTPRNPVSVTLQDVNADGLNDIVLSYISGEQGIILTIKE